MFDIVNRIAKQTFGMTTQDAHSKNVCIRCQEPVLVEINGVIQHNPELFYSPAGKKEWDMSAMCEKCFDSMFEE